MLVLESSSNREMANGAMPSANRAIYRLCQRLLVKRPRRVVSRVAPPMRNYTN